MPKQTTISESISFEGVGLHTGGQVLMTLEPAKENHGYKFQRVDIDGTPIIPVDPDLVNDTQRCTTLQKGDIKISTVEHLLSALFALEIDNVLIKLDASEVPIMDGSAKEFYNNISNVGIVEQNADKSYISFQKTHTFSDQQTGAEILLVPSDTFKVSVLLDYDTPVLGTQYAELSCLGDYFSEIAPCKTYVLLRELEQLAKNGLIKGGDIDNAIVLIDRKDISKDELDELAHLLGKENMDINIQGSTLNNCELQFYNEPARHKLLDVIGDLALLGKPIKGHVIAKKPGHTIKTNFAKILKRAMKEQNKLGKQFDLTKEPLYNIMDIEKMLPHRYPFLLVDKIMEITEDGIIGVKNVTMNEPFFTGHFPNNPVMPGVLQIESMAQTGGIFSLSKVDDPHLYSTYFMKIDNVKFKKKVIPGDTIVFDLKLISPIRRGLVHMGGKGYVNGDVCIEADMLAQVVKDRSE